MQNKGIRFCLHLGKLPAISHTEFKDFNWSSFSTRFEQYVTSIVFKFINNNCPQHLNEVFEFTPEGNISLKNSF